MDGALVATSDGSDGAPATVNFLPIEEARRRLEVRREATAFAREAHRVSSEERRLRLADKCLDTIDRLYAQMWRPETTYGGKDYESGVLPDPRGEAQLALSKAIDAQLTIYERLTGERLILVMPSGSLPRGAHIVNATLEQTVMLVAQNLGLPAGELQAAAERHLLPAET